MSTTQLLERSSSDDADILEILLKLSYAAPPPWKPHFPYLDPNTVLTASRSIAAIISQDRSRLQKQTIRLARKLCSGSGTCLEVSHGSWIGRSLSTQQAVSCLLDVCSSLLKDDTDWAQRDHEQQFAVSYAILNAAVYRPAPLHADAGMMCARIVSRMLKIKKLTREHHRYLAQVWEYSAELPIDSKLLVHLAERSSLGFEQLLLWLGKHSISEDKSRLKDALETSLVSILTRTCSQSPIVFQTVCRVLMHMMLISAAHCGVQELIKSLIDKIEMECAREGCDISALYEESCQVVAALLSIDPALFPESGEHALSREYVLKMLLSLPQENAACLLSHKPLWLPHIMALDR